MQLSELAKAETAYAATSDRRPISYRLPFAAAGDWADDVLFAAG